MNSSTLLIEARYGDLIFYLRKGIISDIWAFEGLLFADEYYPIKLEENDVVLDVGANIGIYTIFCAARVHQVISIEPEPGNFVVLSENVKTNGLSNVRLLNYAVSDKSENVGFDSTGATAKITSNGKVSSKAETLDTLIKMTGSPKITVLKMDIEGYEVKALSSLSDFQSIREIIVETHNRELTTLTTQILSQQGFLVKDVSRVKRKKVIKNVLLHPKSFLNVEKANDYLTIKGVLSHILGNGPSVVSADNPNSDQRILYGRRV